jgi:DNA polymerase III alpha subunit
MRKMPDIDIDFADRNQILRDLIYIPASMIVKDDLKKHNSGVYFQNIPIDPITSLASLDYNTANHLGYFKFDFLQVGIYRNIRDLDDLEELQNTEPPWHKLSDRSFVEKLFHVNSHFDVVNQIKPKNIEDMAIVIAIIRPSKYRLLYKPREIIEREIWINDDDNAYQFKKSHAFGYALVVMIDMNIKFRQENRRENE